jgi:hypothetical protein
MGAGRGGSRGESGFGMIDTAVGLDLCYIVRYLVCIDD